MTQVKTAGAPRAASRTRRPAGKAGPPRRGRYHHGDLRRAMIDGALRILAAEGVAGLSLRAVARRAGVSQAAPYRHFADKAALLAAVAEEGFRALTAAMRDAAAAAGDDLIVRFRAVGLTYIRFAVDRPARFRLMFGREVAHGAGNERFDQAASETFALLVTGIERGQRAGLIRPGNPMDMAMASWSMVHGLSALLVDGQLSRGTEGLEAYASRALRYLFIGFRDGAPAG
jgi:AcrR family transcriptional regulator